MYRSDVVDSSLVYPLEPLPSLHMPIDYLKEPLFFDLQVDKAESSIGGESVDPTEINIEKHRSSRYSGENVFHGDFINTQNGSHRFSATAAKKKMCTSETTFSPETSKKVRFNEYSETRSFVLRREAMLRREQERMEEHQLQDEIPEDAPTPIVLDLNPKMLQPTKATRLRTEFIARRLKQKEMADKSSYNLKGRLTQAIVQCANAQNVSPSQAPVERLTRSAKLFKEHTLRRIREMELESIRKAQEEEGVFGKPVHISHSLSCSNPQHSTAEKHTLEIPFNRATRLLHQRIAERQEEIQKERDKEQAARDAILRPSRRPLILQHQLQQNDGTNSSSCQRKGQHVQGESSLERSQISVQKLVEEVQPRSSVEFNDDFPVKHGDYHHRQLKGPSRSPEVYLAVEQERFSRASRPFTSPQELSTISRCLSATSTELQQVVRLKDDVPTSSLGGFVISEEPTTAVCIDFPRTEAPLLTTKQCNDSCITMLTSNVSLKEALTGATTAYEHTSQLPDSSNSLMETRMHEDTPSSGTHAKSGAGFTLKSAGLVLDSPVLSLREETHSKNMYHSAAEENSPSVAYTKPQPKALEHPREVVGLGCLATPQSHYQFLHSRNDTMACKPTLQAASQSWRSSSGAHTHRSSFMTLITRLSFEAHHSMRPGALSRFQKLYFASTQRLRRRFYMLWMQHVSGLEAENSGICAVNMKWTPTKISSPSSFPNKGVRQTSSEIATETSRPCCALSANQSESLPRGATGSRVPSSERESPQIRFNVSHSQISTAGTSVSKLVPDLEDEIARISVEIVLSPSHPVTFQEVALTQSNVNEEVSLCSKKPLQAASQTNETHVPCSSRFDTGDALFQVSVPKDIASIDSTSSALDSDAVRGKNSLRQAKGQLSPAFPVGESLEAQNSEKLSSCSEKELPDTLALFPDDVSLDMNSAHDLSRPSPYAPTPRCLSPAPLSLS